MPMFRVMGPSVVEEALASRLRELGLVDGPLTRRQLVGFSRLREDLLRRTSTQQALDAIRTLEVIQNPWEGGHLTPSHVWADEDFERANLLDVPIRNSTREELREQDRRDALGAGIDREI